MPASPRGDPPPISASGATRPSVSPPPGGPAAAPDPRPPSAQIAPAPAPVPRKTAPVGAPEPPPPIAPILPGERPKEIGRYTVLCELGRGGMGVVYKGYDADLRREVAIKMVLSARGGASRGEKMRFEREARAAARLRHPGIVSVHEVGEHDGTPYLVMDHVEGETLADLIDSDSPPTTRRIAEIVRDVAVALDHAHAQGVIHRDVKPHNVIVDREGRAHLTDFGLARDASSGQTISVDGKFIGTPHYMSPEQARGRHQATGPRSDVYALGGVLYHALTRRPPFSGRSIAEIAELVIRVRPEPPSKTDPTVPAELEKIAMKCLEKDPGRRYASGGEVAERLTRWLATDAGRERARKPRPPAAPVAAPGGDRGALAAVVATGVAVIGIGVGAAWLVQRGARPGEDEEGGNAAEVARSDRLQREREAAARLARDEIIERASADARAAAARLDVARARGTATGAPIREAIDALASTRALLSLRPDDSEARALAFRAARGLADVAADAGSWELARAALRAALEVEPGDADAAAALADIDRRAARERVERSAPAGALPPGMPLREDGEQWHEMRQRMVDEIESRGIRDAGVLRAMRKVPRHLFALELVRQQGYGPSGLPLGVGEQVVSAPHMTAEMLALCELGPDDRVLEVGTGAGYTAALLAEIVARVHTMELYPQLAQTATARLRSLGYDEVQVRTGDGTAGWPEAAPFDAILVTVGVPTVPPALVEQLAPGGRMVLPVGGETLVLVTKDASGATQTRELHPVRFVMMRPAVEAPAPLAPEQGPR